LSAAPEATKDASPSDCDAPSSTAPEDASPSDSATQSFTVSDIVDRICQYPDCTNKNDMLCKFCQKSTCYDHRVESEKTAMANLCILCGKNQTPYSKESAHSKGKYAPKVCPTVIPSLSYEAKKNQPSVVALWFGHPHNKWFEGSMSLVLTSKSHVEKEKGIKANHTMKAFDDAKTYNFWGDSANYGETWVLLQPCNTQNESEVCSS
jgi:hypothetical protein